MSKHTRSELFPRYRDPSADGDCIHGADWAICEACKHEWEEALALWIGTRNAALAKAEGRQ